MRDRIAVIGGERGGFPVASESIVGFQRDQEKLPNPDIAVTGHER
jgi:hypothetical protein